MKIIDEVVVDDVIFMVDVGMLMFWVVCYLMMNGKW